MASEAEFGKVTTVHGRRHAIGVKQADRPP